MRKLSTHEPHPFWLSIKASATKALNAIIPKRDRARIVDRIHAPAAKPRPPGCEKLASHDRLLSGRLDTATHGNHNGAIMVPFWFQTSMPTTLTLKNIPDAVYTRLKLSAATHRRSMNSEAIVCLEVMLLPAKPTPTERLARARALREALPQGKFRARDIDAFKRKGRS